MIVLLFLFTGLIKLWLLVKKGKKDTISEGVLPQRPQLDILKIYYLNLGKYNPDFQFVPLA